MSRNTRKPRDSGIFSDGSAPSRSSTRVHHAPGGKSNFSIFGGGDAAPERTTRRGGPSGRADNNIFGGPAQPAQPAQPSPQPAQPSPQPAAQPAAQASPQPTGGRRGLYAPIEPFDKGFLKVSQIHRVYYEQCGNPQGNPVVVIHGGPGGGCQDYYRQFFDPQAYRIILMDQRGAGRSTPHAELRENTTWDLVDDLEVLRQTLGVERWVVFGGSWGSTLALAYAELHRERVKAMVLRGIFTLREKELLWFYQEGASHLFPEAWEDFVAPIPEVERGHLMSAYHRRLTGDNEEERLRCAQAWSTWEMRTSKLHVDQKAVSRALDPAWSLAFARIECHYFVNGGFFQYDGQLLANAHVLNGIPGVIVQGRYDVVCPPRTAHELSQVWKDANLIILSDSGHSMSEPSIISELVKATDSFRTV